MPATASRVKRPARRKIGAPPTIPKAVGVRKRPATQPHPIAYIPGMGIDDFVNRVVYATPDLLIETERLGVPGAFFKDLSRRMNLPSVRVFAMLGVPKATVEKKAVSGSHITGSGGYAAIGIAKLLGMVNAIVDETTAAKPPGFDAAKWLGAWLEKPQPALGGRKPGDMIDTPTGMEVVAKLLGSIASGAYQ